MTRQTPIVTGTITFIVITVAMLNLRLDANLQICQSLGIHHNNYGFQPFSLFHLSMHKKYRTIFYPWLSRLHESLPFLFIDDPVC